jgi:hypothetical protein
MMFLLTGNGAGNSVAHLLKNSKKSERRRNSCLQKKSVRIKLHDMLNYYFLTEFFYVAEIY